MNPDLWLLDLINQKMTHPMADRFFIFITSLHKFWWVRFVVLPILLASFWWRFRRKAVLVAGILAVAIGLSDWVNHNVIKPAFARPRPFLEHTQVQNRLDYAPGGFSLPSNHAVNCMVAAAVISIFAPAWTAALVVYGLLIGYSRVYLGVHYPSDVFVGWILGWLWGELCVILIRRHRPDWIPHRRRSRA